MQENTLMKASNTISGVKAIRLVLMTQQPDADGGYICIQELIFNETLNSNSSWRSNMTPSASSVASSYAIAGLLDNVESTGTIALSNTWDNDTSNPPSTNRSCWVRVDFATPITLTEIKVYDGIFAGGTFYHRIIKDCDIEVSYDGTNFSILKQIRGLPDRTQVAPVILYP